jgi:GAF domain-containing protein
VQRATGRGCDIDQVGDEVMNVASAGAWLAARELRHYDAIVLVLGMSDALRLTPVTAWRRDLQSLLDRLLAGARADVRIVLTGIEPVRSTRIFQGPLGVLAQRNADRLNEAAQQLAVASDRVEYVDLTLPQRTPTSTAAEVYAAWAELLTPAVTGALECATPIAERPSMPEIAPRPASPTQPTSDWKTVRALLDEAKSRFGADAAWVSLLDGDRYTLPVASMGNSPSEVPLDLTFCVHTMQQDGALVVPNAKRDPRFRDNPFLDVVHFEFYAGHRLQSASGETIGTFCVAGIRPHARSRVDPDALRDYALATERELARARPAVRA